MKLTLLHSPRHVANTSAIVVAVTMLMVSNFGCAEKNEARHAEDKAKEPAATEVVSQAARDPKRLYCEEHACYEDLCIYCHPEIRDAGRLWCAEHARYEDRCFLCHPELKDANRAYCEKHFLYEDECFMCKPELRASVTPVSPSEAPSQELMCKEHNLAERECGICHPELAATPETGRGLKVRFGSADAAAKGGIETARPELSSMDDGVTCYGEIVFNQNRLTEIVAPFGGIVQSVNTDLGSKVASGAILATIRSPDIAEAVSQAVLTQQTLERERALHAEGISSEKELQQAHAAQQVAHQQLRTFGLGEKQIAALTTDEQDVGVLAIRAPFSGEIVERHAVQGAAIETGKPLFTVADRSVMWAMLNIPEQGLSRVEVGQEVELTVAALPGERFSGRLTWISPQVNDRTRMAQARAEIANPRGVLRAHMFANATIHTGVTGQAVTVPSSAIQCVNERDFVFVRLADDLYEARPVRVGAKADGRIAVVEGLGVSDDVVVAGGFSAKSQLLISRLGAGCVDD